MISTTTCKAIRLRGGDPRFKSPRQRLLEIEYRIVLAGRELQSEDLLLIDDQGGSPGFPSSSIFRLCCGKSPCDPSRWLWACSVPGGIAGEATPEDAWEAILGGVGRGDDYILRGFRIYQEFKIRSLYGPWGVPLPSHDLLEAADLGGYSVISFYPRPAIPFVLEGGIWTHGGRPSAADAIMDASKGAEEVWGVPHGGETWRIIRAKKDIAWR